MRPSLRLLLVPTAILLVTCREEPLAPSAPAGPTLASLARAGSWTLGTPMPTARYGHAAAVATDAAGRPLLYVFGGTDGEVDAFREVEAYDPATKTWTTLHAPDAAPVQGFNGIGRIANKLYLPGGVAQTGDGHVCVSTLQVYDPARNAFRRKADMPHNSCWGVAGVIHGQLYVLTASETVDQDCADCVPHEQQTRDLFRYDPASDTWVSLKSCPHVHGSAMAGVIEGKFYVAGGGNDKLDIYDPSTNAWIAGASLPGARGQGAAAVLGNRLYVIGGSTRTGLTDEVLAYDPRANHWTTRARISTPRALFAAVKLSIDGQARIVAVGGRLPLSATTETDLFTPE